ncbi:Thaumatin family - like 10 [Theobroma cacao]|nr:Thaumatin family - like 10 [Theobroma cacao]
MGSSSSWWRSPTQPKPSMDDKREARNSTSSNMGLNQVYLRLISLDFFDIWLVDGFNVPMDYSPISGGCRGIRCSTDINGQCPNLLRDPGTCRPTEYSGFYKQRCLDVIATPRMKHRHACPGGTNYRNNVAGLQRINVSKGQVSHNKVYAN